MLRAIPCSTARGNVGSGIRPRPFFLAPMTGHSASSADWNIYRTIGDFELMSSAILGQSMLLGSCSRVQHVGDLGPQLFSIAGFALPDGVNLPSGSAELGVHCSVPRDIACEFIKPKLAIALWRRRSATAGVPVPKATVDKQRYPVSGKNDVRTPRQIAPMHSKAIS